MLKDAPILILDEATAFADPDNEARVQAALSRLSQGKTVIMIAHRLKTVRHADQILWSITVRSSSKAPTTSWWPRTASTAVFSGAQAGCRVEGLTTSVYRIEKNSYQHFADTSLLRSVCFLTPVMK